MDHFSSAQQVDAVQAERNKITLQINKEIVRALANEEDLKARIVSALKYTPTDAADIACRLRCEITVRERLQDLLEKI